MRNICLLLFSSAVFIYVKSCTVSKQDKVEMYGNIRTQKLEYRDSLFIMHTIKQWVDSDSPGFHNFSQYWNLKHEQVQYSFGGVFYSPDKKKIVAWIIDKAPNATWRNEIDTVSFYYPPKKTLIYKGKDKEFDSLYKEHIHSIDTNNKECPDNALKDTLYGARSIIGFRDDTNSIWNLYPLGIFSVECCLSRQSAFYSMSQYYFYKMRTHAVYWVNKKNVNTIKYNGKFEPQSADKEMKSIDSLNGTQDDVLEDFGYNLQDKDFWNRSLLWEKGARVKGYYLFQLNGNGGTAIDQIHLPKINYPDSILKLYMAK
jgi:hypothetical protein